MDTSSEQSSMAQLIRAAAAGLLAVACMSGADWSNVASANGTPEPTSAMEQTITNMRAAIGRHDLRSYHMFRADLVDRIGPATVQAALDQYRDLLANLAAANRRHDGRAQARYRAQMAQLCGPETLLGGPGRCDIAIAAARF